MYHPSSAVAVPEGLGTQPLLGVSYRLLREGARAPEKKSVWAAGSDLYACLTESVVLPPGGRALIPTGIALSLPEGYEGQLRPRSGLALSQGLTVLNSPGTIDADYRGEVQVLLINLGQEAVTVVDGMRVAQLVVAPVVSVAWTLVAELDVTVRGEGGFGHTGV